ncbi:MAG TPA: hypothetical protein VIY48_10610 [Candidatus Paceibacterota bacterium]
MAATQRNLQWYRYVDDSGRNWAIRTAKETGDIAGFGLTAFNSADPPFGPQSRRHHPRKAVYIDPTTFRTSTAIVGTAAAFAAVPATLDVVIPGEVAAVTYSLSEKVGEKLQVAKASRPLADHA